MANRKNNRRLPLRLESLETRENPAIIGLEAADVPVSTTAGDDRNGEVAMRADGTGFVVAYSSPDAGGLGVFFKRYDANWQLVQGPVAVNTFTANDQVQPSVAMDAAGNFVIAYESFGQDSGDTTAQSGIYARRYNAAGTAVDAAEFQVNTTTVSQQRTPDVGVNAAGQFTIVFRTGVSVNTVLAQSYTSTTGTLTAVGGEITVKLGDGGSNNATVPTIALDATGNYAVTYQLDGLDGSGFGIYAQRRSAAGAVLTAEFPVNTVTAGDQQFPDIAMDGGGNFNIVWYSPNVDGSGTAIVMQRYNSSAVPQGGNITVNTGITSNNQLDPHISATSGGNFLVTWYGDEADVDAVGTDAYYKMFNLSGGVVIGDTLINLGTASNDQSEINAVSGINNAGDFVIAFDTAAGANFDAVLRRYAEAPVVQFASASSTGSEATTTRSYTVNRTAPAYLTANVATAVSVTRTGGTATPGSDFSTTFPQTVTIAAGSTSQSANVTIINDTVYEPGADETILQGFGASANYTIGATSARTLSIVDDDPAPTVSISNASLAEGDSGSANLTFTVTLSPASGATATVNYATANGSAVAGIDYTSASGTLTFAPGETTKTFTVPILGNTIFQANRQFTAALSVPVNSTVGTGTGTATINDDDAAATITISSGNNQSTSTNSNFASPLVALVRNVANNAVQGVSVVYTAPAAGASSVFSTTTNTITVTTNASGLASTGTFAANGTAGANYSVSAAATGGINPTVNFTLSNVASSSLTATLSLGTLTVTDAAGVANNLTVSASGANLVITDANEQFAAAPSGGTLSNGNKTLTIPMPTTVVFNAAGGGDTILVDYVGGDPIPTGGLTFNGDLGADALAVKGTGTESGSYRPSNVAGTNGNAGTIVIGGKTITFDGLAPVDIASMASFTVDPVGVVDVLDLANGTNLTTGINPVIGAQTALVVSGTSSGTPIETAAFWNIGTLTINTAVTGPQDGSDTLTVTSATGTGTTNVTNLAIVTGAGTDTVSINGAIAVAGSVSINTVNVSSTAAGTINTGTGVSVTNTGVASTMTGIISGAGTFTKAGTGTLTLSGLNTFTGNVTISGGVLVAGASSTTQGSLGAFNPAPTKVNVQSGATLDINGRASASGLDFFYGVTIAGTGSAGQGALINNGASGNIGQRQTPNITLSGNAAIGGTGDFYMINGGYAADTLDLAGFTLTKIGANTFFLVNTTATAGTIQINNGTVGEAQVASNLTAASVSLANTAGATLALNNLSMPLGALSGGGTTGGNVTLGTATLTVGNATSTTFGGVISGTGSVTKTGTGTLTLTNNNTYTGATTISQGTLQLGNAGTAGGIAGASTITLGDAGTGANNVAFLVNRSDVNTHANAIVVSASGSGTATIGSTGTAPGPNATVFTGTVTLNRATTMQGTDPDRTTYQGVISGNVGTLTVTGGGRTTWEQNNTFVGNVLVTTSGTVLQVGGLAADQIPDASNVDLAAGTFLRLNNDGEAINALTGSGTVENIVGANTLTVGANNGGGTFTGFLNNGSGALSVTKTGTGTQTFAGGGATTNSANGTLAVTGGTLVMGAGFTGDGAWQGNVTVNTGATLQLAQSNIFNNSSDFTINGTFNMAGFGDVIGNLSGAGAITNNGGIVLDDLNATFTYTGTIAGGGGLTLRGAVANTGTQVLSGTTYNFGGVVVGRGTLTFSGTPTVGITGTFAVGDTNGAGVGSGAITGIANIQGGTFTIGHIEVGNRQSGSATVVGTINQSGGAVSVTGAPADSANVRVGHWPSTNANYNLIAGTLTATTAVGTAVDGTGTFTLSGTGTLNTPQIIVNLRNGNGNGTFNLNAGTANIGAGGITTTGGLSSLNYGGATIRATANWSSSHPAALTNVTGPAVFDTNGFNIGLSGVLSGVGGLSKNTGTGILTLSGANSYTGVTTVNAGSLNLAGGAAIVDSGAVVVNGGNLNLTNLETIGSLAGAVGTTVTLNANTLSTGGNNTTTTYAGVVSGTGGLNKQGTGSFTLSGTNTFTGMTQVFAGTLSLANGAALADSVSVQLAGGTLDLQNSETIGSLLGVAGTTVALNANTLTTGGNGSSTTHAGTITGTGGLTKEGSGTFILTGTNTYSGVTNVNFGTLYVNGTNSGTGAVNVNNDATLGGIGSIAGPVNTFTTSNITPGTSPESLATGNLTLVAGTALDVEIGGTAPGNGVTGYDQLVVTGSVNLGGADLNVTSFGGFIPAAGQSYTIIDNDGTDAVTGTFNGLAQGAVIPPFVNFLSSGLTAYIVYDGGDGNDVVITVNTAPTFTVSSATINEDDTASSTIVITDADPLAVTTYAVEVTWGERTLAGVLAPLPPDLITGLGNANAAGTVGNTTYTWTAATKTLVVEHQYLDDNGTGSPSNTHTLRVRVADNYMTGNFAGAAAANNYVQNTATITVNNMAPTAVFSVLPQYDPIIVRNSPYTFVVDNIVDPGTLDTFTITWDFGDGSPVVVVPNQTQADLLLNQPYSATYDFPNVGDFTVTVTVTDDDTGAVSMQYAESVRVVVVMPNGDLHIGGTNSNNVITVDAGPSPSDGSQNVRVFMDNVYYGTYGPTAGPGVTDTFTGAIRVFAGGGTDVVNFLGTTGDDAFTIDDDVVPAQLTHDKSFSMNGRTYTTLEGESYFLKGMSGEDTFAVSGLGLTSGAMTRNVAIEGGNGNDVLLLEAGLTGLELGANSTADWVLEGPERGTLEGVLRFNTVAAVAGNDEPDSMIVNTGGVLYGTTTPPRPAIDFADGDNVISFAGQIGGQVFTMQTGGAIKTNAGLVVGADSLVGGTGNDRLVGAIPAVAPNTWDITGINAGTYISDGVATVFSSMESLMGGGGDDEFNFTATGALTGSVDGALGSDTLSYASRTTGTVNTNIGTSKTTSVTGTFAGIDTLVGGGGSSVNTLTAANGTNTWNVTGDNDGTLNALTYVDYGTLVGGTGVDQFILGANGLADSINGGTGNDVLSFVGATGPVNVTLNPTITTGTANRLSAPTATVLFSSVEGHVGSGNAVDTFTTTPNGDTILITGANAGKVNTTVSFSAYTNLIGGGGNDTYTVQGGGTLTSIDAAGGTGDTLVGPNLANAWTFNAGAGTLNGINFAGFEKLTGGTNADTFTLTAGTPATLINGGSGNDTIDFGAGATVSLTSATAGSSAGLVTSFSSIEGLVSSAGTINGANIASTWKLTGLDQGTLNTLTKFTGFGTINGSNTATDRLLVNIGGLSGNFNAGTGSGDILDYSGVTTITRPYTVPGATLVSGSVFDGMGGMLAITGFNGIAGNL